ncbi:MAG: type II toxin-antitoxin system VapC family toxin [Gemmatimonadota bacterium]
MAYPGDLVILDTSAIIAILQKEASAPRLLAALEEADVRRVSAATLVEAGIILHARFGDHGERELDLFVQRAHIEIIPLTEQHAELARSAYRRFGKGRSAAGLNFGDCFSYSLARALDEPLLFVGDDFPRTDVRVACS